MTGGKSQTKPRAVQPNNDLDAALPHLSESDIQELISFFELLATWDREAQASDSCKKTESAR